MFYLKGEEGVDIAGEEDKAVVCARGRVIGELVDVSAALEAKGFKDLEGGFSGEAVDVHFARLLNDVVRVVFFVDRYADAVGGARELGDGIYDQAVVLFAIVGGDDVKTVADLEKSREIVLVGGGIVGREILARKLLGKGVELRSALVRECGKDLDVVFSKAQVSALFQHAAHYLGGKRCPAAVLNEGHGAVGVVALGEVVDKGAHKGEDVGVIGGGGEHELAVAEGVCHGGMQIRTGEVVGDDGGGRRSHAGRRQGR